MLNFCLFLAVAPVAASQQTSLASKIRTNIQPFLDDMSAYFNTSFSVGFFDAKAGAVGVASGIDDHRSGTKMSDVALIPMGSVTKTWTAVAVLQLAAAGKFSLDDAVAPLVNKILTAENGTTFEQLWGQDPLAPKITLRHLLSMRAGPTTITQFGR